MACVKLEIPLASAPVPAGVRGSWCPCPLLLRVPFSTRPLACFPASAAGSPSIAPLASVVLRAAFNRFDEAVQVRLAILGSAPSGREPAAGSVRGSGRGGTTISERPTYRLAATPSRGAAAWRTSPRPRPLSASTSRVVNCSEPSGRLLCEASGHRLFRRRLVPLLGCVRSASFRSRFVIASRQYSRAEHFPHSVGVWDELFHGRVW